MHNVQFGMRTPLSRRMVLRAAGAALTLPLLESMLPRSKRAWAATQGETSSPRRFVGMMTNMGILPEYFFPANGGRDYDSTPYLDILKDHRSDMTVFSGVSLPGVDGGHGAEKSFLTGAPGASRGSFKNSISLDQVIAHQLGASTRFPSLSIMVGSENLSLSWTRDGSMIPAITSPLKLFQQLFVDDSAAGKMAAIQRLQEDRSLLDGMLAQYQKLQKRVTVADRHRLDQYTSAIRDLERQLAANASWIDRPKPKVNIEAPKEIADRNDLILNSQVMFDLVRLALETDSTRCVTIAFSTGSITPKIQGVSNATHTLTHHGQQPEKLTELRAIEEVQFQALAAFFTSLKERNEQGQTLLDRTTCLFGTNMGSANSHANTNLPVLLAGGGFQHGQHLAFDKQNNYPLSDLYVSILQRMGIEADTFASSHRTMRGLEMKPGV